MTLLPHHKIFVTGHRGLVGSAVLRTLQQRGFENVQTVTHELLDLRDQLSVSDWFATHQPEFVIHCAGRVGGILANANAQAEFLYDNLMMQATVLKAAHDHQVKKLLYLGSSCIYPRNAEQPIKESSLLTGALEPTNEGYAIAKISGVKSCDAYRNQYGDHFISAMPTNLYGPHDNFSLENSHVLPALMRKFHEARQRGESSVVIWGTGQPQREFLHVDDLASACLFLLENYNEKGPINVGTGQELSIAQLAETIRDVVYPGCQLEFDTTKPDGTLRKLLDIDRLHAMGWKHSINLEEGIQSTYEWFQQNQLTSRL